jgi:threonine aldolase
VGVPGVEIAYPVQANAVFARLPAATIERVRREIFFYVWDEDANIVRLMCSYDTTAADVTALVDAISATPGRP